MDKKLPIYDVVLKEDDQGVGMISLVDDPAIKVNWIKLAKQAQLSFKSSPDKQMLYGPFLIPNMLIYRFDEQIGEYYVRFSKEEIDKIATKFNSDLNNKNINFMHSDVKVEAFVAQNWVIESDQDKSKGLGFDLPDGTWFGGVKVTDQNFWNDKVKSEEVKGFSVEILADLELSLKNKEQIMKEQIKLGSSYLQDGTTEIYWEGDALAVGAPVFLDEAMSQPAPDGIHMLENGDVIKLTDGKVEIYAPGLKFEDEASLAAYPWDQCIEDQMKQYGDKAIAEAVCGKIKSQNMSEEELAVDPNAVSGAQSLTAEEVSLMIDSRFSELMDEMSKLKAALDMKEGEMNSFRNEVNEKFSSIPATGSIKKEKEVKLEDKFSATEARIREFAKSGR